LVLTAAAGVNRAILHSWLGKVWLPPCATQTSAEIHLGCGAMSSCWLSLFECPIQLLLAVKTLRKAHKDACHSFVIAVIHWHLCAETHHWEGPYFEMCGCSREAWCFMYHGHHTYTISWLV